MDSLETLNAKKVEQRAMTLAEEVGRLTITDHASLTLAGEKLSVVKGMEQTIAEFFEPLVSAAFRSHKALTTARKKALAPLEEAERILKARVLTYEAEQEAKRLEEEARLAELARKQAEADRLAEAIAAEESGDVETAAALLDEPLRPVSVHLAPEVLPPGMSKRETWKAVVVDLKAFARGVADGIIPCQMMTPNMSALDAQARMMKGLLTYPGVITQQEFSLAQRAKE